MMRLPKQFILVVSLAMSVVALSGCVALVVGAAAAGAGGYAWIKGALVKEFDVSAEELYKATKSGLKGLAMRVTEDQADRVSAVLAADFADGKKVKINIEALTEVRSQIRIRVDVFGDKSKSELILNAVERKL
jgi:NAD/NADP transhydrogenase alpha subunit